MSESRRSPREPQGPISPRSSQDQGQSVVEFILMLAMAVGVMVGVSLAFRKSLRNFWWGIAKEVTAPCPDCKPPPELRKKP